MNENQDTAVCSNRKSTGGWARMDVGGLEGFRFIHFDHFRHTATNLHLSSELLRKASFFPFERKSAKVPRCCQTNLFLRTSKFPGSRHHNSSSRCSSFTATTTTPMAYVQVEADDVSTLFLSLIQQSFLLYQPIATSRRRSRRSPVQMYARFLVRS